jgi:hypothetical protein
MSPTLTMMRNQVSLFQKGQISIDKMWENIDNTLQRIKEGQAHADHPFDDDKAERSPPARRLMAANC